jgi:hypothetical protein
MDDNRLETITIKMLSIIAATGLTLAAPAQARKSRGLRRITASEAAPLQNAMTQSRARRLCRRQQLAGSRESRASINKKMSICIQRRTQGRQACKTRPSGDGT